MARLSEIQIPRIPVPVNHPPGLYTLAFALATLQAAGLVLVIFAVLHVSGDLDNALDGLSTAAGLALFSGFWLITWYVTLRALATVLEDGPRPSILDGNLFIQSVLWGGIGGVLSLYAFLVGFFWVAIAGEGFDEWTVPRMAGVSIIAILVAGIGGIIAFPIGIIVGVLFGLIDAVLLSLAEALVGGPRLRAGEPMETKSPLAPTE
jgi:hypothetical protein